MSRGRSRGTGSRAGTGKAKDPDDGPGVASRRLAIEAMIRIDRGGAFANLMVPNLLADSTLPGEDRRFVTNLVYGATRMRRACDHLVDRFLLSEVDHEVRAALRIGCHQLVHLDTPPHAAVAATVGAVTKRKRSIVNAVLRRVAEADVTYPDEATRLSYPDWIHQRVIDALGEVDGRAALEAMNRPAETTVRGDGYIQDEASQQVVAAVGAEPGETVVDLCAAPGGKATGMAASGAMVVGSDRRPSRARLVAANARRLGAGVMPLVADGRRPPVRAGTVDRVLVDAPCSGFGSFRRRPDSRWRIDPDGPHRLAELQVELVTAGLDLLRPGGVLVYSVCTFGSTEGREVIEAVLARSGLAIEVLGVPGPPWVERDGMATLLPERTDGMMLARLRRTS